VALGASFCVFSKYRRSFGTFHHPEAMLFRIHPEQSSGHLCNHYRNREPTLLERPTVFDADLDSALV
jgi:hypothetical protein